MFGNTIAYEKFMGRWSRLVVLVLVDFAQIPDSKTQVHEVVRAFQSLAALAPSKEAYRRTPHGKPIGCRRSFRSTKPPRILQARKT
jgi:hypothetical protein